MKLHGNFWSLLVPQVEAVRDLSNYPFLGQREFCNVLVSHFSSTAEGIVASSSEGRKER